MTDTTLSMNFFFEINPGQEAEFRALIEPFVTQTRPEEGCLDYTFCFNQNTCLVREVFTDAAAFQYHGANVAATLAESRQYSKVVKIDCIGPAEELEKLKPALDPLGGVYYVRESGFRR